MFWTIVIASVFISAMHFQQLRLVTDSLFRQIGMLNSLAYSASAVSLCEWPPLASGSTERYFSGSHNMEKHPSAAFWLQFNQSILWSQEEEGDTSLEIHCSV